MKKNDVYKGFKVLDVVDVPDCNSTGIYLKHERTGMEIFHLLNKDEENLFTFSFRTPSLNSTGAAHVLEHSVLCGSQKYPLKDPFINMSNQSVNTFLNAFTYTDRTAYPAASTVKADYFNLMSVYADAVFFPLLENEIFMQECHRLELDENGKPSIQGVVYNEMKGSYSDLNSVAASAVEFALLKDTSYEYQSGGDPLVIPYLTHSQLKAFHKRYYNPANCLVFLYGNIPTEEQLDFIDKNVLSKFESGGKCVKWEKFPSKHELKHYVKAYGPASENGDGKSIVNLAWTTGIGKFNRGELCVENLFLSNLLWGDDSAPVAKALLDSDLGVNLFSYSGATLDCQFPYLLCGLEGVDEANAKKVEKVINDTLKDICKNGIPEEDLQRTCLAFEFNNKEIKRAGGPYSIVYMDRCIRGWQYGEKPWTTLQFSSYFEVLKQKLENDKDYLPSMIKKYMLENKEQVLVTVTPSAAWSKKRTAQEQKIIKEQYAATTREKVLAALDRMHKFQSTKPTEEENNLLPRIHVSDLTSSSEKFTTAISDFKGHPLFVNKQPTNGITYFDVCFPADILPAKEYSWLTPLCVTVTDVGWNNISWEKTSKAVLSKTGGISAHFHSFHVPHSSEEAVKGKNYTGRDWVIFSVKVLEENTSEALNLLADCITATDFSDEKRVKDVLKAYYNSLVSEVVPAAHSLASMRSTCTENRQKAIAEVTGGLKSFLNCYDMTKMDIGKVASHLRNLLARIKKAGGILHVTATEEGVKKVKKCLPEFIEKINLGPLQQPYENTEDDFIRLTSIKGEKGKGSSRKNEYIDELIEIPGTVAFDAMAFECEDFDTKESVADIVWSHSLTNCELWNTIRMSGGAYGVWISPNADNQVTRFMTYRDPKPFESFETFASCVKAAAAREYTKDEVEKAITGCYSDEIYPKTPCATGLMAFFRELSGLTNAQKQRKIKWLLKMTPKDMKASALRHEKAMGKHRKIVFCGKELISSKIVENSGKIIKLPL